MEDFRLCPYCQTVHNSNTSCEEALEEQARYTEAAEFDQWLSTHQAEYDSYDCPF